MLFICYLNPCPVFLMDMPIFCFLKLLVTNLEDRTVLELFVTNLEDNTI